MERNGYCKKGLNTMNRHYSYAGHQNDFRRFNRLSQLNAAVDGWLRADEEISYWKERAIRAEQMNERLFAQCKRLSLSELAG